MELQELSGVSTSRCTLQRGQTRTDNPKAHDSEGFENWADVNWSSAVFIVIMQEVIS